MTGEEDVVGTRPRDGRRSAVFQGERERRAGGAGEGGRDVQDTAPERGGGLRGPGTTGRALAPAGRETASAEG